MSLVDTARKISDLIKSGDTTEASRVFSTELHPSLLSPDRTPLSAGEIQAVLAIIQETIEFAAPRKRDLEKLLQRL